jgi:PAS domain S-box-containing protein
MKKKLSHEEYKLIVEKAPIMIWRSDLTMGCDYFNDIWLNFTGRTMEQEFGNGWAEGVHPEDFESCLKIYSESFPAKKTFEMEYRLRRFDGAYRWIFDRGFPYSDESGIFKGYIGSCIDITENKEAREALRLAQEAEIKQLRGILPICSYCKKIRNDKDYWVQLESYISAHSLAQFSHGICPECLDKVMSRLDKQKKGAV